MKGFFSVSATAVSLMPGLLCAAMPCADQVVVIDLINSAGLSARNLEHATRRAGGILITTGRTIYWRRNPGDLRGLIAGPTATSLNYNIRLRIAGTAPSSLPKSELAYSLPSVHVGTDITIFYDRVKQVSQDVEIDSVSVLGLVMAHEIGHMLLRSKKHSATGIMKSPWTKSDVQHWPALLGEFTSLERSSIRQCTVPEMLSDVRPAQRVDRRREALLAPE